MGDAITQVLQFSGAAGGTLAALGLCVKYVLEAWQKRRSDRREDTSSRMTDAATANAMLLSALKEERIENSRKGKRIYELEQRVEALSAEVVAQRETHDDQIRRARAEAERQISVMREQIEQLTRKLTELQRQISTDLPSPQEERDR